MRLQRGGTASAKYPTHFSVIIVLLALFSSLCLSFFPTNTALAANSPNDSLALPPMPHVFAATSTINTCDITTLQNTINAASSGDTISFNCSGTIVITGTLVITKNLTLDGSGQNVTISGNNTYEVFSVNSGANLTLNNLTIANGNGSTLGGGIYNSGTITIVNSSIISNSTAYSGGGIYNNGTVSIINSSIVSNSAGISGNGGGGIYNNGTVSIINSTFISNSAVYYGGGIYNNSTLSINDSSFISNSATNGGAIYNSNSNAVANLTNSTFISNFASYGGAVYNNNYFAHANFTNSTFISNSAVYSGGVIFNYRGIATFTNNVLAHGTYGANCYETTATFNDSGGNLSNDNSCSFSGSVPNNNSGSLQLNLGSLQNNGGATQTVGLLAGSAAIGAATANCPATDQRGVPRINAPSSCDAGAFQSGILGNGSSAALCTEPYLNAALATGGYIAIECPPSTTITVTAPTNSTSNYRSITTTVTLDASPSVSFTLSGGNSYELFYVNAGASLTINNLTIANGKAITCFTNQNCGGGIYSNGKLTITNSIFSSNTSGLYGGGIYLNGGTLNVSNSIFANNSAPNGGAIFVNNSTLTTTNTTFVNNSGFGGAIFNGGTVNLITATTFISNTSSGTNGGAILNFGVINSIANSTFAYNTAASSGAAIYNFSGATINSIANSTFAYNNSVGGSGTIYNQATISNINNSTFAGNKSNTIAGIFNSGGTITVTNSILAQGSRGNNCYGTIGDGGYNLSGDVTCSFSGTSQNYVVNLTLGPLANNGGATQTVGLLPGSAALGYVATGCPNIDQRGVARPATNCDAGAYEASANLALAGPNNPSVYGQSVTLTATVSPNSATGSVTFTDITTGVQLGSVNLNNGVATLSVSNLVAGINTIVANYSGDSIYFSNVSNNYTQTVWTKPLTTLSISPSNASIAKGNSQVFTVTATYSDNSTSDVTSSVSWSSSNTTIATVSSGVATGLSLGNVIITATDNTTGKFVTATLTVGAAVPTALAVNPANAFVVKGGTQQFTATLTYSDGSTQDVTNSATWQTKNASVATINSSGLATGQSSGSTSVTASYGGLNSNANIYVNAASLQSLAISPATATIAKGTSQVFTLTATFSDGSTQDVSSGASWSSGNITTASVSSTGVAVGLAQGGPVDITATYAGQSKTAQLTVTSASLVSVAVTPAGAAIAKGTTQQYAAIGYFSDNSSQTLSSGIAWASSSTNTASIDNNGLATAVNPGSTTITATATVNGLSASGSTNLNVTNATLQSLSISPNNTTIAKGTTQQFAVTGSYSDGTTQDLTSVVQWSSSDTALATVSNQAPSYGLAKALAQGSVTITATDATTGKFATTILTVGPALPASLAVSPANSLIVKGGTQQFAATLTYSDNSTQDVTSSATWSSSNNGIATITSNSGLATGQAIGTTIITATYGAVSGSAILNVSAASLQSLVISPATGTILKGTAQTFTAIATFSDGTTQNLSSSVVWISSDSKVATMSNLGLAQGLAPGSVTISATFNGISSNIAHLDVTLPTLENIVLALANPTIAAGSTLQLVAVGNYSDATTQTLTTGLTWTTGNANVATVSSSGLATGLATGTTVVTATDTATNVAGSTSLTVTGSSTTPTITTYTYYLPFVANNAANFTTYLAFQNIGTASANITVTYYDTNGNALTASTLITQVAKYAEVLPGNPFVTGKQGTGIISSDQPLNVIVPEATPYGGSAYAVASGSNNTLVAPFALNNAFGDFTTQLNIFNGGSSAVTATVTFYGTVGNSTTITSSSTSVAIQPHTTANLNQNTLPSGFSGWAQISGSANTLVAQVLEQSPSTKFVAIANAVANPSSTEYAPAIFNGGYGSFYTGANIINPNSNTVTVTVTYHDLSANALPTAPFVIPAHGVASIFNGATSGNGIPNGGLPKNFIGSMAVSSVGGNIAMSVNENGGVTSAGNSRSGTYAAIANGSSTVGLPVVSNGGYTYITGNTILNTSSQPVSATITYYNTDGTSAGVSKSFTISGHGSQAYYQGDGSLTSGFYGTAVITETSGPANSLVVTANAQNIALFYTYSEPNS